MARSMAQIEQDYKDVKVTELRKLLAEEIKKYGVKGVDRDGETIRLGFAKRDELLALVSRLESMKPINEEETIEQTITEKTTIAVEPISEEATTEQTTTEDLTPTVPTFKTETEYTDSEALLKRLATKYYQGFKSGDVEVVGVRQFAQSQLQNAQMNQSLMDTRLFATVAYFKEEIVSIASDLSDDGEPNPSTVINLRGEVLNRIKKTVNSETESKKFTVTEKLEGMEPIITNYLAQSFEAFRSGAIASFSSIAYKKRTTQGTNFLARRTSTPHASVSNLVQWAINRLKNLPIKAQEWREVALAIMIVTGRRPAEVMSSGVFKAIDQTNLEFYGQLKKKKTTIENDERSYKIPAIGDTAKEVEAAIQWLEMMNKRTVPVARSLEEKQDAAKKCHDRFSRYLSEVATQIMPNHLVLADGADWDLPENRSRIKPYLSRQIYLQIISKSVQASVNNGVSIDPDLAVTYYSGHYLSKDGKDANAENYLADIVISDMSDIEKIWNWKPDLTIEDLNSIKAV